MQNGWVLDEAGNEKFAGRWRRVVSCEVLKVLKCGWSGVARTVEVVAVGMIKGSKNKVGMVDDLMYNI